jgi:hypothetical protein
MNIKQMFVCSAVLAAATVLAVPGEIIHQDIAENTAYPFTVVAQIPQDFNKLAVEDATVTYRQDGGNLCVIVDMVDGDVVSEALANQTALNKFGDAVQIFIKPENSTHLWEVIAAPGNRKSCFFHWGAGRMFYPPATEAAPFDAVVKTVKTAKGWRAEIVFPLSKVAKQYNLDPKGDWTVMAVRHHYGRNLSRRDTSACPQAVKNVSDPRRFGKLFRLK